jgi:hypothetical protein
LFNVGVDDMDVGMKGKWIFSQSGERLGRRDPSRGGWSAERELVVAVRAVGRVFLYYVTIKAMLQLRECLQVGGFEKRIE